MRAYKTVNDTYIEPISFTVPRRAETFQSDIYPPATGLKPAVSAKEWLDGKSGLPPKIDLESVYDGKAPVEVASDYKPPASSFASPPPSAKPVLKEEPKPTPAPVPERQPVSAADQKASISAMANKYQDQEEDDSGDDDDASSFEEISRPPQRTTAAAAAPPPVREEPRSRSPAKAPVRSPISTATPVFSSTSVSSGGAAAGGAGTPADVSSSLREIKELIQAQHGLIRAQSEQITHLTQEVETLKRRVTSGSQDQSERIRQLELELETLRS